MEQFYNYFKNRKEVEQFFKSEMFRFSFMSDNIIHFESLNPISLRDELFSFNIRFYYEDSDTVFCYSSFKTFFDKLKLHEIICISEADNKERVSMFFSRYDSKQ